MSGTSHQEQDIPWIKKVGVLPNEFDKVAVTARRYEEVLFGLGIPDHYFFPDMRILSVGEGLSDFADRLSKEKGVKVIAIDPIYSLGQQLLQSEPKEVRRILEGAYSMRVNLQTFGADTLPVLNPSRIISSSVYDLPFSDNMFDLVVSHHVLEHIDLALAAPEMVRVTKPNGEIRLGKPVIQVLGDVIRGMDPDEIAWYERLKLEVPKPIERPIKQLLTKILDIDGYFNISERPFPGNIPGALKWISRNPSLTAYLAFDTLPKRSALYEKGIYMGGPFIIRKDNEWPQVVVFNLEDSKDLRYITLSEDITESDLLSIAKKLRHYPDLRRIFRINPRLRRSRKSWPREYYELVPQEV